MGFIEDSDLYRLKLVTGCQDPLKPGNCLTCYGIAYKNSICNECDNVIGEIVVRQQDSMWAAPQLNPIFIATIYGDQGKLQDLECKDTDSTEDFFHAMQMVIQQRNMPVVEGNDESVRSKALRIIVENHRAHALTDELYLEIKSLANMCKNNTTDMLQYVNETLNN